MNLKKYVRSVIAPCNKHSVLRSDTRIIQKLYTLCSVDITEIEKIKYLLISKAGHFIINALKKSHITIFVIIVSNVYISYFVCLTFSDFFIYL